MSDTPSRMRDSRERVMRDTQQTEPKPFVFVLMPFDSAYDDIYKYGIKGATAEVGAYAERLDEQVFTEGMLDRIFNQISKADVIVADMTGRNPNVFYEVGYAHALNKVTVLLTRDSNDIPFDLKHRQHIVYQGSIDTLRKDLIRSLSWAITESRHRFDSFSRSQNSLVVSLGGVDVPVTTPTVRPPLLLLQLRENIDEPFDVSVSVVNPSPAVSFHLTNVSLLTPQDPEIVPYYFSRSAKRFARIPPVVLPRSLVKDDFVLGYKLNEHITSIHAYAVDGFFLYLGFTHEAQEFTQEIRLRLHEESCYTDYDFVLKVSRPSRQESTD